METAYIERYIKIHLTKQEPPTCYKTVTLIIFTTFRPLPGIPYWEPKFTDTQYQWDPPWDDDLYNQKKLQFKKNFDKLLEQTEVDAIITNSHVSNQLRKALIDLWTVNPQLPLTSPLPNFTPQPNFTKGQNSVIETEVTPQLQSFPGRKTTLLPLSTNLQFENKMGTLYSSLDFEELTVDVLIDTGALTSAISERKLRKVRLLAPHTFLNIGPSTDFQKMVATLHLETTSSTVDLQFETGNIFSTERFIVMMNLTNPLVGLLCLQKTSKIQGMGQGGPNFFFFYATQARRQLVFKHLLTFVLPNKHPDSTW